MAHRKVFVRELAGETTSEKLKDSFAGFGDIEEASVDFDKPTGKSSGCGFVTFTDMETAQRVVQTKTIVIDVRCYCIGWLFYSKAWLNIILSCTIYRVARCCAI